MKWYEKHSAECGTKYRGCAPDCPKEILEQQLEAGMITEQELATRVIPGPGSSTRCSMTNVPGCVFRCGVVLLCFAGIVCAWVQLPWWAAALVTMVLTPLAGRAANDKGT